MILVTGATGVIGSAVVAELCARGAAFRVFVRDPAKVAHLPLTVDRFVGDLDRSDAVEAALRGITHLFWLSPHIDPTQVGHMLTAARAEGVRHIVKLSTLEAGRGTDGIARWHGAEEQQIEASRIDWTFVRPGNFASNALSWASTIRTEGKVYAATGDGKSAPIDPRDIAAVIALALTEPGHVRAAYRLTGPTLLSAAEQTAVLSRVLQIPLDYVDTDPESMGAQLRSYHVPAELVAALIELWHSVRVDAHPVVTHEVERLLGRPARTFEQWARDHVAAFA
jgi:uncharacterized protein YbjT (DUF2867 family)